MVSNDSARAANMGTRFLALLLGVVLVASIVVLYLQTTTAPVKAFGPLRASSWTIKCIPKEGFSYSRLRLSLDLPKNTPSKNNWFSLGLGEADCKRNEYAIAIDGTKH